MYKYICLSAFFLPLVGIFLMGQGAYGVSVGEYGYHNGALLAFSLYSALSLSLFFMLKSRPYEPEGYVRVDASQLYRYCFRVLFLIFFLVLVMLFGFDAFHVWTGDVGKGEFRANLGSFGFFAYLTTKYIAPLSLAYAAFLYSRSDKSLGGKLVFSTLILAGLILGSTWGFKSTGVTVVLPAFLILFWSSGIVRVTYFSLVALSVILIFSFMFGESTSLIAAIKFILVRLTVLQGDVAWYVWGVHQAGLEFPPYSQTLAAALSDTFLENVMGLNRENYQEWVLFHYDLLLNRVAGLPDSASKAGHTIVGTPFSEGLIMGGAIGVFFMAIISGLMSAFVFNKINKGLARGQGMVAAFWATYFCVFLFPWLRGGAIVQLFHVGVVISFVVSFVFVVLMAKLVYRKKNCI